ncbi:MAG: demethylmenaquinone methyltransferase [Acidobacteriota bacterium]|nr:demethylmenaquinone methyltransferase [Acidobacteriota bacterium]
MLLGRLVALDCCVVSDALDALGLPPAITGIGPVWACGRMAGRAVTVSLEPVVPGTPPPSRHLGTEAISQAGPGDVIVVSNGGRTQAGAWGGLLALAASLAGVRGVVIDGACRDVDEMEPLGLAVFARAPVARTARRRFVEVATNVAIGIGDVPVAPGDLVLADGSGVAVVPADRAEDVIAEAERMAAEEAAMAALLRSGRPAVDVLGRRYETMMGDQP